MAILRTTATWDPKDLAEYLATVRCGGTPFLDRGTWSLGSDNNVWMRPDGDDGKTYVLTSRNYEGSVRYTAFLAFIASTIGTVEMDNRRRKEQLDKFVVNDKTLGQHCAVCEDRREVNLTHGARCGAHMAAGVDGGAEVTHDEAIELVSKLEQAAANAMQRTLSLQRLVDMNQPHAREAAQSAEADATLRAARSAVYKMIRDYDRAIRK